METDFPKGGHGVLELVRPKARSLKADTARSKYRASEQRGKSKLVVFRSGEMANS